MMEEDDDARIVSSEPLTARIRPMTAASEFKLATRWILRVVPDTRGNWLFGTKLFRAMRDARLARLSLHHGDFHSELRLDLSDPAQFTMVKRGRFDLMTAGGRLDALRIGVRNALLDPKLELHNSNGSIAANDDWQTTQIGGVIISDQVAEIQNSGIPPGNRAEPYGVPQTVGHP